MYQALFLRFLRSRFFFFPGNRSRSSQGKGGEKQFTEIASRSVSSKSPLDRLMHQNFPFDVSPPHRRGIYGRDRSRSRAGMPQISPVAETGISWEMTFKAKAAKIDNIARRCIASTVKRMERKQNARNPTANRRDVKRKEATKTLGTICR